MNKLYNINREFYYVYEHWLDGKIIYVGKGKGFRAYSKARNVYWEALVGNRYNEVNVIIRGHFEREEDALMFENILIVEYIDNGAKLCNIIFNSEIDVFFNIDDLNRVTKREESNKLKNEVRVRNAKEKRNKAKRPIYSSPKKPSKNCVNPYVDFPPEFMDIPLTKTIKERVIEELNILDSQGRTYKWRKISEMLEKQGYTIINKQVVMDKKRKRISIVQKP